MPDRSGHFTISVLDELGPERSIVPAIAAAPRAVNFLVLPYLGPYAWFLDRLDRSAYAHAERPPARSLSAAIEGASRRKIPVAVSYYEVVGEGVFYATTAVVGRDGSVMGSYRQAHAVNRPGWHEQLYFSPGTPTQLPVFEIEGVNVGLLLGGDLWVPETARALALHGADVLIAQTGRNDEMLGQRMTLAEARAIENGRAVVLANRGGKAHAFTGTGGEISPAESDRGWSTISIDLAEQRRRLLADDPLRIRRPRLYGSLASDKIGALS